MPGGVKHVVLDGWGGSSAETAGDLDLVWCGVIQLELKCPSQTREGKLVYQAHRA